MKTWRLHFVALVSIALILTVPVSLLAADGVKIQAPRTANTPEQIDRTNGTSGGSISSSTNPNRVSATLNVPGSYLTIQAAIDAATAGDIIQVAAGTYTENLIVTKEVTIAGAGAASTIVIPALSSPNPPGASSLSAGASNLVLVQANNVTIHDLTLDGDNTSLTSGVVAGGADIDARNGIITNHTMGVFSNLIVYNVTVKNIYLRGMYASSGGSFNFHDNTVQNVQASTSSIAIFNFGGTGSIANNIVSDANDAIAANWSTGTQFLNNTVTNSGSGIHSDNNGGYGGVADLIQGNSVSNSASNGYGVWVFFPYFNTTVNANSVTNVDVALFAWGGAGGVATFTNNTVNGQNRANCIGAYASVGTDAWGSYQSNVTATFSGNSVQNTSYGFIVETDETTPLFNLNVAVASHTTNANATDVYLSGLGVFTTTGLSGNTVLVSAPARIQDGVGLTNSNGTLNVGAGTYQGRVEIAKSLTLQGAGETTTIFDGTGLAGYGSGILIGAGLTNVAIKDITVQNYAGNGPNSFAGIYAVGQNNGLTIQNVTLKNNIGGSGFYANGPVNGVTLNNLDVSGHPNTAGAARGIVFWNGLKENITITNCDVYNNNCCGIELQDGTASGVTLQNNNIHDNGDNGIGLVGLQGPGENLIKLNTIANNGRFGIEVKNPNGTGLTTGAGRIVVEENTVSRTLSIGAEVRDIVGIAAFRRSVLMGNVDVPTGVVIQNNTVSGYVQPSTSDGFGIVAEGMNHKVTGNTVTGCDVGIQRQAGHTPYPGDGDQSNLADAYFGRGNSPVSCGIILSGNTLTNTVNTRDVGAGAASGLVTNVNTAEIFCSIQSAIDDAQTLNGHTLTVGTGTFKEQINIAKGLTLVGDVINPDNVVIDGENKTTLASDGQVRIYNPSGDVAFKGFKIINGGRSSSGTYFAILTKGSYSKTIQNCKIIGHGSGVPIGEDYGVWAYTAAGDLTMKDNFLGDMYHAVLLEQQYGAVTIEGNTFDNLYTGLYSGAIYGGRAIEAINYGSADVVSLQKISGNTFSNFKSTGVLFSGGFSGQTPRKFTNVLIENNAFNFSVSDIANLQGAISLKNVSLPSNNSPDGGVTANIRNNYINVPSGPGIQITGLNGTISCNNNSVAGIPYGMKADASLGPVVDASSNWWGTVSAAGRVTANVDYTPWLSSGTDADGVTPGFQPTYNELYVGGLCPQTGAMGRIAEGLGLLTGNMLHIMDGNYAENVVVNRSLSLLGAGAALATITGNGVDNCISVNASNSVISGLTLTGGKNGIQIVDGDFNLVQNNTISANTGAGVLLTGAKQNTISGNIVSGNNYNLMVEINGTRTARGNRVQANTFRNPGTWSVNVTNEPKTTSVNFNVFGVGDKYVRNSSASLTQMLNATYNWFGGEAAPGPGTPDFSGAVDFAHNYATLPTVFIAPAPAPYYMPQNSTIDVAVMAMIPSGTTINGTKVFLSWDNDLVIPDFGNPIEGSFYDPAKPAANSEFHFIKSDGSSLEVDQVLVPNNGISGGVAEPYMGVLFTQKFQANVTDGTSHVKLDEVLMRNTANEAIEVNLDPDDALQPTVHQATLIVDGTAPVVSAVTIDNTTNTWTDAFVKNGDGIAVTATVSDPNGLTTDEITANLNGFYFGSPVHGADNPSSYVGSAATWTPVLAPPGAVTPPDGPITVTVTATDLAGNIGTGTATITADNTPPASASALTAKIDASSGQGNVKLNWTAGADDNYRGVVIRYNTGSYPLYPSVPTAPALPGEGTAVSALFASGTTAGIHTTPVTQIARNIYAYSVFAIDQAGNYAPLVSTGSDMSTNYYLADIGSGSGLIGASAYDGKVNGQDLQLFSMLYFAGLTNGPAWYSDRAHEADFGPVTNNKSYTAGSQFGIPRPDGKVEFEDLMIFSMNYNKVGLPKMDLPSTCALAQDFSLSLQVRTLSSGEIVATVHLGNDGREVKGAAVELTFDPAMLAVAGVDKGDLFGGDGLGFYGYRKSEGSVRIEAAVLGEDVAVKHSGNVATIHFRVLKSGDPKIALADATIRNAANAAQQVSLKAEAVELPTTFDLSQNYPNPFNPTTVIKYQLPSPVAVDVAVYNVLGEKVATLVNEVQEAGYYSIEWNGRDSRNTQVSTGMYIYTMKAGEFSSVKKMMLVK